MPTRKVSGRLLPTASTAYLFPGIANPTMLFLLHFNRYVEHILVIRTVMVSVTIFVFSRYTVVFHFNYNLPKSKNFVFSPLYLIMARIWIINFTFMKCFKNYRALSYTLFAHQSSVSLDIIKSISLIRKCYLWHIKSLIQGHMLARTCTQVFWRWVPSIFHPIPQTPCLCTLHEMVCKQEPNSCSWLKDLFL